MPPAGDKAGADPGPSGDRSADLFGVFGATMTASFEAMQAWSQTWQSLLETRGGPTAALMTGAAANPATWPESVLPILDEMTRALALPRFADLPRLDAGLMPSAGAPVELALLVQQYLGTMLPVWIQACEAFQGEVARRRAGGEPLDVISDGLDIWNTVLDRTLMAFNRSPEFGDLQKRLLRLAMQQRQEVRRRTELVAEAIDMPTRTELRDVYERLHGLMREVHGLRREVRALRRGQSDQGQSGRGQANQGQTNQGRAGEAEGRAAAGNGAEPARNEA